MSNMSTFIGSAGSLEQEVVAIQKKISGQTGRNRVLNGHMSIAQRGVSFPAIANNTYNLDRWVVSYAGAGVRTVTQELDAPLGFIHSMKHLVTTIAASYAAAEQQSFATFIEGYRILGLLDKTFTLSFWVKSSKTGIYSVSFRANTIVKSYVGEYTINAANTWEKKSITVVNGLPSTEAWSLTTSLGLRLFFSLGAGTNWKTAPGSWVTGNFIASNNQVNLFDTLNATFSITGVQLELGEEATEFEIRSISDEILSCQRYFYRSPNVIYSGCQPAATTFPSFKFKLPTRMRAVPTITYNPLIVDANFVGSNPTGNQWTCNQSGGAASVKTGTASLGSNYNVEEIAIIVSGATFSTVVSRLQTASTHIFDLAAELA